MSAAQNRFSETLSRADEVLLERTRRELAKMKAEDAAAEVEAVEQARADSFKRTEIASRYDDAFQAFGERVPMPGADERPGAYRMRLYEALRRRLPSDNEWAGVRADSVPSSAAAQIEQFMISAATAEGLRPSVANLPPDREIVRNRIDPTTGERHTEFFAKESFVKQMGRPGRQVLRILNPRTGAILMGPPMPHAEMVGHYSPY